MYDSIQLGREVIRCFDTTNKMSIIEASTLNLKNCIISRPNIRAILRLSQVRSLNLENNPFGFDQKYALLKSFPCNFHPSFTMCDILLSVEIEKEHIQYRINKIRQILKSKEYSIIVLLEILCSKREFLPKELLRRIWRTFNYIRPRI